jgi:hypothetical protein
MSKQNLLATSTINLRTLLANGKRYEVPAYQRDYSWKQEHWEDLWFDVLELDQSGRQHYMGALVLEEERADDFRVIDGQQRLATLREVRYEAGWGGVGEFHLRNHRDDVARALRVCDVISFRYNMISQRNTNKLEEVYNDVAVAVHQGTLKTAAEIQNALQPVYISDDAFKEAFAKRSLPTGGRKTRLLRYMLCALEKQEYNVDYDWENTPATIEHVLPENPTAEWLEDFPNDLHERYVSRLGNYLLLESKLNSKTPLTSRFQRSCWSITRASIRRPNTSRRLTGHRKPSMAARHTWQSWPPQSGEFKLGFPGKLHAAGSVHPQAQSV